MVGLPTVVHWSRGLLGVSAYLAMSQWPLAASEPPTSTLASIPWEAAQNLIKKHNREPRHRELESAPSRRHAATGPLHKAMTRIPHLSSAGAIFRFNSHSDALGPLSPLLGIIHSAGNDQCHYRREIIPGVFGIANTRQTVDLHTFHGRGPYTPPGRFPWTNPSLLRAHSCPGELAERTEPRLQPTESPTVPAPPPRKSRRVIGMWGRPTTFL